MSGAVAIFVKTPGLSPVKTRLQRVRSAAFAEEWHRLAARATASVVTAAAGRDGFAVYWAVAEDDALQHPLWSGLPRVAQGDGDLGERMARVHALLVERHGFGILLGADAPQLQADALQRAAAWLRADAARCAIGFAEDGGFWLHGGNRIVAQQVWTGVRYGGRETGRDFRLAMAAHGECLTLPSLCDVDEDEDLLAGRDALALLPAPTAEQSALLCWLDAVLQAGVAQQSSPYALANADAAASATVGVLGGSP
jgi:uncharacterized protein